LLYLVIAGNYGVIKFMDKDAKIIFFHLGRNPYLKYVLYQTKFSSPGSSVILLGEGTQLRNIDSVPLGSFKEQPSV